MGLPEDGDKGEDGALPDRAVTYQLWLHLAANIELTVGALGRCAFPAGWYVYTGSAKRGLRARLRRHSHPDGAKTVHWHADYLLASPQATVHYLILSAAPECAVNAAVGGCIPCPASVPRTAAAAATATCAIWERIST